MSRSDAATPELSVIIASRNRAARLPGLLERLAAQETPGRFTYEVLVVDNGSTDDTRRVVEGQRASFPATLRYVYEGRRGKPWALNTGVQQARGDFLVFTDDDVLVTPQWLRALRACFREEGADAVTGKVLPRWVEGRPGWLTDEAFRQIGGMGCIDYGERRVSSLEHRDCRWVGGNMAIRREAARRLGAFDLRMLRAQDTEYYRRALRHGLKIVYEPAALAYHQIPAERLTPRYFRQWRHRTGYFQAYQMPWKLTHLLTIMPLWRYRLIASLTAEWLKRIVTRSPWWDRFNHELFLREHVSIWLHRVRLWPRWWLTVLTGRSHLPWTKR